MSAEAPEHPPARPQRPGLRRAVDGWRRDFRLAMANTGHTHDSVAAALSMPRQHLTDMLSVDGSKRLTADHVDALERDAATHELWVEFLRLQALRAGVRPLDCQPLDDQLQALIEHAQKARAVLGRVG